MAEGRNDPEASPPASHATVSTVSGSSPSTASHHLDLTSPERSPPDSHLPAVYPPPRDAGHYGQATHGGRYGGLQHGGNGHYDRLDSSTSTQRRSNRTPGSSRRSSRDNLINHNTREESRERSPRESRGEYANSFEDAPLDWQASPAGSLGSLEFDNIENLGSMSSVLGELGVQTPFLSPTKDGVSFAKDGAAFGGGVLRRDGSSVYLMSPDKVDAAQDAAAAALSGSNHSARSLGGSRHGAPDAEAEDGGEVPRGFLPPRIAGTPPRGEVMVPRTPREAYRADQVTGGEERGGASDGLNESQHGDSAPMVHNPPLPRNPPGGRRRSRGISGDRSSDDRPSDGPGRTPPRRGGEQEHHGEDSTTPHGSAVLPPLGSPTPPRYGGYHAQGYAYGPGPHGVPPHLSHPLGNDPAAEDHHPAPVAPYGYYYQQYPGHGEGQGGVAYDAGHGGQPYGGGGYGPPDGQGGGGYSPRSQDYRAGGPHGGPHSGDPQQYRGGQDGRDDVRTEGSGGTAAASEPGGVGGGGGEGPAGGTPRRSPDSFILEVSFVFCRARRDDGTNGAWSVLAGETWKGVMEAQEPVLAERELERLLSSLSGLEVVVEGSERERLRRLHEAGVSFGIFRVLEVLDDFFA